MGALAEWARLLAFAGFVLLGLLASRRRRLTDALLVYVLAVTAAAGFSQKESWPFSNWALVHHMSPKAIEGAFEVEVVAGERTYRVDPRAWQPLALEELQSWLYLRFRRLDDAGQASVARFLLEQAEASRRRVKKGEPAGRNAWLLGPLAAPYHFLRPPIWRSPADVPDGPFTRILIVEIGWDVEARAAGRGEVSRRVAFEYP